MSTENTWSQIQEALAQLHADRRNAPFYPLLDKLQRYASVQHQDIPPPEVFKALIKLVQLMGTDVHDNNRTVQEALDQAVTGTYQQQEWVTRDVYQANGHIFNFVLDNFRQEVAAKEPDPRIPIRVVLLVMNADEAQQLISGEAFKEYPEEVYPAQFKNLERLLEERKIINWMQRYRETAEDWRPFSDSEESIGQLVTRALSRIEECPNRLVPSYVDIRELNERENRGRLWELRQNGCIIIKDTISMQHPVIQRAYRLSLIDAFPNTLVIRIAPVGAALRVEQQLVRFSERYIDLEFYKRFDVDEDDRCGQVSENVDFRRWLRREAPRLIPEEHRSKSGIRSYYNKPTE